MAKKKRKGGDPRKRSTTYRTPTPPCAPRSLHLGREVSCKFSSSMSVGGGPKVASCSWCGRVSPGSPKVLPPKGPEPEEVPDSWFSSEEPVVAVSVPEWQALVRRGREIQRRLT